MSKQREITIFSAPLAARFELKSMPPQPLLPQPPTPGGTIPPPPIPKNPEPPSQAPQGTAGLVGFACCFGIRLPIPIIMSKEIGVG